MPTITRAALVLAAVFTLAVSTAARAEDPESDALPRPHWMVGQARHADAHAFAFSLAQQRGASEQR